MTTTKIYKEEKIAQRIKLVIRTSCIIGNQYLPACDTNENERIEGVSGNSNFIDEIRTPKKAQSSN